MTHDHLCPAPHKELIDAQVCTYCELIRAVRKEYNDAYYPISPI